MRVEGGAVVDEFELPGVGHVIARHIRTRSADGDGWACTFTVVAPGNSDLSVVHRLSAPSLAEARRGVRNATEFLAGRASGIGVPLRGARSSAPAFPLPRLTRSDDEVPAPLS